MDGIECGIVKLPRVPVADNTGAEDPRFLNLREDFRRKMSKRGCGKSGRTRPAQRAARAAERPRVALQLREADVRASMRHRSA